MRRFLYLCLTFGIAFFILEKLLYIFLIISPKLEVDNRLEKVINGEVNKDLIIIGSSRGARNIIASQIEDSLNISSYNLSYPGSDIEFHEFLLRSITKFNTSPKNVILVVDDPYELLPTNHISFRYDRLYPLSKYNYINNELIDRGEKTFLSKIFVLARINKKNFDLRRRKFSKLDSLGKNKSMPLSFQQNDVNFDYGKDVSYDVSGESASKLEAFIKFQKICVENKINLLIVFPPNFERHGKSFERRIRFLSDDEVFFYIYDRSDPVYKDEAYFYDETHLQKRGAIIFTAEIVNYLIKHSPISSFPCRL
ncbi:hypothetical protein EI546_05860 [Aequorivita sp. H23M31]|uniref:DUF1574 domain-containing protein n=1 Tax=Aequorivita ciconiae TaxID=2494375 RepID=A0A410G211_9FLAO|nr:hypothetical protein [Aequorivita sp. H23M31]QAA81280.1 hypothetical protein EI546_05860 [Aequorivita sp. H23M31]